MSGKLQTSIVLSENGNIVTKDISLRAAARLYQKSPETIYSNLFFKNIRRTRWQILIGKLIVQSLRLPVSSAVDFGCAAGYYLEGMRRVGVKHLRGFDYSYTEVKKYIPNSIAGCVTWGNVMEPINCGRFDLAMSIEVAEHILPEASVTFVQNLTSASTRYVILTAARPGQKGVGHINCRRPKYWIALFQREGFCLDAEETGVLQQKIRAMPHYGIRLHKYLHHIMVFKKDV